MDYVISYTMKIYIFGSENVNEFFIVSFLITERSCNHPRLKILPNSKLSGRAQ